METSTFVKQLASNNRVVRENALEKLIKYIQSQTFKKSKQSQFDKLWKGLYFSMWFSDRPRPQQRLASQLGGLYMKFFDEKDNVNGKKSKSNDESDAELCMNDKAFIKFSKAFWKIMLLEWMNIDQWRLDKYLLLIRRVQYYQIKYLQARKWDELLVEKYVEKVLKWLPLSGDRKVYNGMSMHIVDIFLDEWERMMRNLQDPEEEKEEEFDYVTLVKETPLQQFMDIFIGLTGEVNNSKVLKEHIHDTLLNEPKLIEYGIKVPSTKKQQQEQNDSDDPEDNEEEWTGF